MNETKRLELTSGGQGKCSDIVPMTLSNVETWLDSFEFKDPRLSEKEPELSFVKFEFEY